MNDNDASVTDKPARRAPWNKGKLIGPKPPLRQGHVCQFELGSNSRGAAAILPSSTSPSTASCAVAMWWQSASTT